MQYVGTKDCASCSQLNENISGSGSHQSWKAPNLSWEDATRVLAGQLLPRAAPAGPARWGVGVRLLRFQVPVRVLSERE